MVLDPGQWHAFIEDSFPAYISPEQYGTNLRRLAANRARAEERGAVRHGPSLLQGLLICGKCGHRVQVRYGGPRKPHTPTPAAAWPPTTPKVTATVCPAPLWTSSSEGGS